METLFSTTIYETPFPRAEIMVTGKTTQQALENSRVFCNFFKSQLPETSIIWKPEPRGFSDTAQSYTCLIRVTFGPEIEAARTAVNALRRGVPTESGMAHEA